MTQLAPKVSKRLSSNTILTIAAVASIAIVGACFLAFTSFAPTGKTNKPAAKTNAQSVYTQAAMTVQAIYVQTLSVKPTPTLTETPAPTPTGTPLPQPIALTGSGDSIVDVTKWDGPAVVHIKYASGGNLIIQNYGTNNERIDLLVNTIGAYEGTVPIDFLEMNTLRVLK